MSIASKTVRITFKASDDKRDAGLTTPEDIQRADDIVYGASPKEQSLDVYRPKEYTGKLPVIVSVHGGGWVYGDKERYQYYCMSLAQRGFAVVNYTYRLAPEHIFPASLEDTNLVFTWLLTHAEEYDMDPARVFALGDSAGAHLLGLYCALCTEPDFAKQFTFSAPAGFVPKAVALNCGEYAMSDPSLMKGNTRALMGDLLGGRLTAEKLRLLDVTLHLNERFPPTYLMTCTGDFLADQAPVMSAALMRHGVPHELHYYADGPKELGHVFHCNMRLDAARRCNDDECAWFQKQV